MHSKLSGCASALSALHRLYSLAPGRGGFSLALLRSRRYRQRHMSPVNGSSHASFTYSAILVPFHYIGEI